MNKVSENCWNFWRDGSILAGVSTEENIFFNNQSWDTWLNISTNMVFITDIAGFLGTILTFILTYAFGTTITLLIAQSYPWGSVQLLSRIPLQGAQQFEHIHQTVTTKFSGTLGKLSIYLQQTMNLQRIVKASSIVGMFLTFIQLGVQLLLTWQRDGILEKISHIELPDMGN
jgi:hypothetical protein